MLLAWFDVLLFSDVSALMELELGVVEDVVAEPLREPEVLLALDGLYVDVLLVDDEGDELILMFVSLLEAELLGALAEDWL